MSHMRGPAWCPATTPGNLTAIFHGWLDNLVELAAELGHSGSDQAEVYAAAVERWGRDADSRCHGSYCAIVERADGAIRLSRSPWAAPPLTYATNALGAVVASVPRVLFAAGHPQTLDLPRLGDNLFYNLTLSEDGWYRDTFRVPYGAIVTLTPQGATTDRWYDPCALPEIHLARDEDYPDAVAELLGRAVELALRPAKRPAMALSGGLDSSIVADEILRRMPRGNLLRSFTAVPDRGWDGIAPPGMFGDERGWVERFATQHPNLQPTFLDRPGGGFDDGLQPMLAAMGIAPRNLANGSFYHAIGKAAADAGCDWLLTAELGNVGLSNDGRWSYVEFLTSGRWRQLYRTMAARSDDPRPIWRRIAALSILPLLPKSFREAIRGMIHPDRRDPHSLLSMLRPDAVTRLKLTERAGVAGRVTGEYHRTRAENIRYAYDQGDVEGGEVWQGFEQVHGLRVRDVTAYRPLLEFCLGLPTDQLVRDGTDRFLARRLAKGRMPEEQRLNSRYGRHNADWHARLTPRRAELRAEAERFRENPVLAGLLDIDRLIALLDDWPDHTPLDPTVALPREVAITRAIQAARFTHFVSGRNDI